MSGDRSAGGGAPGSEVVEGALWTQALVQSAVHDLKTPLNAILGYAELAREDAAAADLDAVTDDVHHVWTAARLLLEQLDALVELSRRGVPGPGPLRPVELGSLLDAAVAEAGSLVPSLAARVEVAPHLVVSTSPAEAVGSLARIVAWFGLASGSRVTVRGERVPRDGADAVVLEVSADGLDASVLADAGHVLRPVPSERADARRWLILGRAGLARLGGEVTVAPSADGHGSLRVLLPHTR